MNHHRGRQERRIAALLAITIAVEAGHHPVDMQLHTERQAAQFILIPTAGATAITGTDGMTI